MATDTKKVPCNDELWTAMAAAAMTGLLSRCEQLPEPEALIANCESYADAMVALHATLPAKREAAQKAIDEKAKADAEAEKAAKDSAKELEAAELKTKTQSH
jgi:hypothetical protein